MATGRTLEKYQRFYADGYDLSGDIRKFGEFGIVGGVVDVTAPCVDAVKGALVNRCEIKLGDINVLWSNTTPGEHTIANGWQGSGHCIMLPIGQLAAPLQGDRVFAGTFTLKDYVFALDGGLAVANFKWGDWDQSQLIDYVNAFGFLLHAKGAETAVHTAIGIDDHGASSVFGGWMNYQLFTSNGTVTLKIQDAATNTDPSFADLSGATSGSINASVTPASGVVALGRTATVRRYLRWQLVFGTATTATFALSFHRATF